METLKAEVEAYLKHILEILEEDVTFEIEDETPDGLYVNLVGSMFSLPEERPILAALEHLLRGRCDARAAKRSTLCSTSTER